METNSNVSQNCEWGYSLKGHNKQILSLDLLEIKNLLLSGSEDNTSRIWDIRIDTKRATKCILSNGPVSSVRFSPTEEFIIYIATGNTLSVFDLRRTEIILKQSVQNFKYNSDEINQIDIKGTLVATADDSGEVKILDTNRSELYRTLRNRHTNICTSVKFHPLKAGELFSGGMDSTVIHWDYKKLKPIYVYKFVTPVNASNQIVNPPMVHSMDISNDGRKLAAGLADYSAVVYDTQSKKKTHHLEFHNSSVSSVTFPAFNPIERLITGSTDRMIALWDLNQTDINNNSLAPLQALLGIKHKAKINWITSSSNGDIFVADENEEISVYKVTDK